MFQFLICTVLTVTARSLCLPDIRLVHVQDSTSTFGGVIDDFKASGLIERLIDGLREKYGSVEYGLSRFQDKPGPLVGYGPGYSVWSYNHVVWDQCYTLVHPLSPEYKDAWRSMSVSGGKDAEENQLEGIALAARDPIHWRDSGTHNSRGQPIARIVMMVTDDVAHNGKKNQKHFLGYDTTYKGTQRYWKRHFGSYREDVEDGRIASDFIGSWVPFRDSGVSVKGVDAYRAFLVCTQAVDSDFREDVSQAFIDAGVFVDEDDLQGWWSTFCDLETKTTGGVLTGLFSFSNEYLLVEPDAITEYPYERKREDCEAYEYPDSSDPRFAEMFSRNHVIPVALVTPPALVNEYEYRSRLFDLLASHCPVVRASCSGGWFGECVMGGSEHSWAVPVLEEKLGECYWEHYGEIFGDLRRHGVESVLSVMDPDKLQAEALVKSMARAIDQAVQTLVCLPVADSTVGQQVNTVTSVPSTRSPVSIDSTVGQQVNTVTTSGVPSTGSPVSIDISDALKVPGNHGAVTFATAATVVAACLAGVSAGGMVGIRRLSAPESNDVIEDVECNPTFADREVMQVVDAEMYR
ncbi:MAG: uncharacterized protein KVP18_004341 [Porospora cf. gigantea A]|uniref:uncharacterized protein n=1 Tax=Porospora cf. gigantea A TaxID=2853593 RepID=UPI00355981A9|nr:MAG: hypothetical protein KVP18_004341 [Porospora cf. gigantea A]